MFLDIFFSALLGVIVAVFTGLSPGVHVNLVSSILLEYSGMLGFDFFLISCFIISLAIAHSIFDSIPSIFLGAPDESMIASALPGHRLLINGDGKKAVILNVIGCVLSVIFSFAMIPVFIALFRLLYEPSKVFVGYILAALVMFVIFHGKNPLRKKFLSLVLFVISGMLGMIVFKIPVKNVLLPLLSGLFGVSGMILGLSEKTKIPFQKETCVLFSRNYLLITFVATVLAAFAAFFPGFSTSHTAIFSSFILKDMGDEGYLVLNGAINTANMAISVVTLYSIEKARNGAIVTISSLLDKITFLELVIFFLVMAASTAISAIMTLKMCDWFSRIIPKVNYSIIAFAVIGIIVLFTIIFSGIPGILILIASTALGIICAKLEIARNNLLGCLVLSVILYFI